MPAKHYKVNGSMWIPGSYVSNNSRIEPSKAFPRRLTLWTNSKKPKYSGKYVCERPRCGRNHDLNRDQLQSMDRSLHPPLLQNPACDFHRTRLLSDVPLILGISRARQARSSDL